MEQTKQPTIYAYRIAKPSHGIIRIEKGLFDRLNNMKLFFKDNGDIFQNTSYLDFVKGNEVYCFEDKPVQEIAEPETLEKCLEVLGPTGGELPRKRNQSVIDIVSIYPFIHPANTREVFNYLKNIYENKEFRVTKSPSPEEKGKWKKIKLKENERKALVGKILRGIEVADFSPERFPQADEGYFMWG